MDLDEARERLVAERDQIRRSLGLVEEDARQDHEAEAGEGQLDQGDAAQTLTAEYTGDAVAESLRDRLERIGRALRRVDDGTWGRSVRSGVPIPPERLEADPAAELTVEEAAQQERIIDG
jgi:DnaK suppressor protein